MSRNTESALATLAGSQWGMLTAAQAAASGIARSTLFRREQSGTLERLRPGVYRLPGAPADRLDEIRAAWLSTAPSTPVWERQNSPDVVVGGAAAAWTHEVGDLYPSPILLYTSTRRQTKRGDVRYSTRRIPAEDVTLVDGLPVTTRERTISDLFDEPGADVSLVADALRDAERADADLDTDHLIGLLGAHAKRLGYKSGADLYGHLRSLTRVDEDHLRNLLAHTNLREVIDTVARDRIQAMLAPMYADLNEQVKATLAPLMDMKVPPINFPTLKMSQVQLPQYLLSQIQLPQIQLPKVQFPPETQAALAKLAAMKVSAMPPDKRARLEGIGRLASLKIDVSPPMKRVVDDAARPPMRTPRPAPSPRGPSARSDEGEE